MGSGEGAPEGGDICSRWLIHTGMYGKNHHNMINLIKIKIIEFKKFLILINYFLIYISNLSLINCYWSTVALQCCISLDGTLKVNQLYLTYVPSFVDFLSI